MTESSITRRGGSAVRLAGPPAHHDLGEFIEFVEFILGQLLGPRHEEPQGAALVPAFRDEPEELGAGSALEGYRGSWRAAARARS